MDLKENQVVLTFLKESEAIEFHAAVTNEARVVLIYQGYRGIIKDFDVISTFHLVESE